MPQGAVSTPSRLTPLRVVRAATLTRPSTPQKHPHRDSLAAFKRARGLAAILFTLLNFGLWHHLLRNGHSLKPTLS